MANNYIKKNEFELTVEETLPVPPIKTVTYERKFIEQQIINITKDRDNFIASSNAEIAKCNEILTQMKNLNILVRAE